MPTTRIHEYLSAYFTLSPQALLSSRSSPWREFFPFSSAHGMWTFSGRVALFAGLQRLQLAQGSSILMPRYFQGTEIDTLLAAGFSLRFYDLDEGFRVDTESVERAIDGSVSALYIIHYFGIPQNLDALTALCRRHGIALIEDCALAFLSRYRDSWVGSHGDMALFSIYKSLPLPHGGYLVTKSPGESLPLIAPPRISTLVQTAELVAQHLRRSAANRYLNSFWENTNAIRLQISKRTTVSGTLTLDTTSLRYGASPLIQKLMNSCNPLSIIARRRANFTLLHSKLAAVSPFTFDTLPSGACPLFYPIVISEKVRFRAMLAAHNIGSVNLWSQPHPLCPQADTAQTTRWRRTILELPIHQQLDSGDIERIAQTVLALLPESSPAVTSPSYRRKTSLSTSGISAAEVPEPTA